MNAATTMHELWREAHGFLDDVCRTAKRRARNVARRQPTMTMETDAMLIDQTTRFSAKKLDSEIEEQWKGGYVDRDRRGALHAAVAEFKTEGVISIDHLRSLSVDRAEKMPPASGNSLQARAATLEAFLTSPRTQARAAALIAGINEGAQQTFWGALLGLRR